MTTEQQEGKTPAEKAEMIQLKLCNELGALAIDRTSKEIFQKVEKDERKSNEIPLMEESSLSTASLV